MTESFTSRRVEVELDALEFLEFTIREGWGDGLPCIPPTENLVAEYVEASSFTPGEVLAKLPPSHQACTVEHVAINAAMTGCPPAAMDLICAALKAMMEPDFNLASLNATTASVTPMLIVNGEQRDRLSIPYQAGCFGGAKSMAPAIGRAIRLILRNVAGQEIGTTSACVFGQPARVTGLVVGEWEEESPWRPLAERRGVPGDAVTVFGTMGTANICDTVAQKGDVLLELIGKSVAYLGCNSFVSASGNATGEIAIALNPVWAKLVLGRDFDSVGAVQERIWDHAAVPIDFFPSRTAVPSKTWSG